MDKKTRNKILDMLKREGPSDAGPLADKLGITAMAVRQHLYDLAADGLVDSSDRPRGVGRPLKIWSLTGAADRFFPSGYAELTADLIGSMRQAFGEEGLDKIVATRLSSQTQAYRSRLAGCRTLRDKLGELAVLRTEEGYMAKVEEEDGNYLFLENHCPICAAARLCTGLCTSELQLFRSVLGADVTVERSEHILSGARRCAYRISGG